jgi:hypothetical protein
MIAIRDEGLCALGWLGLHLDGAAQARGAGTQTLRWTVRGNAMAWLLVAVAGILETGFAVLLKQSHGITRVEPPRPMDLS